MIYSYEFIIDLILSLAPLTRHLLKKILTHLSLPRSAAGARDSIDVFGAFFITYAIYDLVVWLV